MVQGVRGIQARLERHGGPKATTTCTTWQRPVFRIHRRIHRQEESTLAGGRRPGPLLRVSLRNAGWIYIDWNRLAM
jgi:hypothetical protein